MNQGLQLKLIQKTRKERYCQGCGKLIPKCSNCITATGLDYDDEFTNWSVHTVKSCYMFYIDNIDMIDEDDILSLFTDTCITVQEKVLCNAL